MINHPNVTSVWENNHRKKAEKVNDPSNVKIRRHVVKNDKIVAASAASRDEKGLQSAS